MSDPIMSDPIASDYIMVHVTFPDLDSAGKVSRLLVENKLAACVHVYPEVLSIYRWQGEICEDREVAVQIKTRRKHWQMVQDLVNNHHPYDVPVIACLPVCDYNPAAAKWFDEVVDN